jgi:hypothetical protein
MLPVIIPIPESATHATLGFHEESLKMGTTSVLRVSCVCLACVLRVSVVDVTTKKNWIAHCVLCRGSTYMPMMLPTSLDDAHELFRIADVMTHELMTHMPRLLFQGARASSTLASSVTRMWGGHSFRRRSSCVTSRFCASSTPWSTP